jgi:hypothetical protein
MANVKCDCNPASASKLLLRLLTRSAVGIKNAGESYE